MKILHYFLGFPPYRSGGLTRYAYDLMIAQKERGDEVVAVWPGRMNWIQKDIKFIEKTTNDRILSVEVINPLPVSLDEGIKDIPAFVKSTNISIFKQFFEHQRPDAIHIHTLMGLYKEFVDAANDLGIKTVFTTHDYFGICPKVTLYHNGSVCTNDNNCRDCVDCNKTALSISKIRIMQSYVYRVLKDSNVVTMLRRKHRSSFFNEELEEKQHKEKGALGGENYRQLRDYYISILEGIDVVHYNSTLTKEIYEKYITPKHSVILPITHKGVMDHRKERDWHWTGTLRLTCLAPAKPYKGYNVLKTTLDRLWEEGNRNFVLKIFSPVLEPAPYMQVKEDGFLQSDLKIIFSDTDVLIAPSIWFETFGFTVLEALSYGVPVIVSDHVGAKDIVNGFGEIIEAGSQSALASAIRGMTEERLMMLQRYITDYSILTWADFINQNYQLYK